MSRLDGSLDGRLDGRLDSGLDGASMAPRWLDARAQRDTRILELATSCSVYCIQVYPTLHPYSVYHPTLSLLLVTRLTRLTRLPTRLTQLSHPTHALISTRLARNYSSLFRSLSAPSPPSRPPTRRDQSILATPRWLLLPYPSNHRASGSYLVHSGPYSKLVVRLSTCHDLTKRVATSSSSSTS